MFLEIDFWNFMELKLTVLKSSKHITRKSFQNTHLRTAEMVVNFPAALARLNSEGKNSLPPSVLVVNIISANLYGFRFAFLCFAPAASSNSTLQFWREREKKKGKN